MGLDIQYLHEGKQTGIYSFLIETFLPFPLRT